MHQCRNTIQKIKDIDAYRFKLDKKKFRADTEVFHKILQICPRLLNQDFVKPPSEEELVTFIQELGYSGKCDILSAIHTDLMHQPWRTSEDFMYQADNKEISSARKEHMPYPRFTEVIISHLISKDKIVFMRNILNLYTIRDDTLLDIKDSKAYKTYYNFATGKATPKKARKFKKVASPLRKLSHVLEEEPIEKPKRAKKPAKKYNTVPTAGVAIRDTPSESVPKKKTLAKVDWGKGMDLLSDVALLEAAQLKKIIKKSKLETHKLHASGSDDLVGSLPKSENESERDSSDDDDNDDDSNEVTKDDDDVDSDADGDNEASDNEKTDSDKDVNHNLNQNNDDEEENKEEYVRTPDSFKFNDDDDEEYKELYKDVNVRLTDTKHEEQGKEDEITDASRDDNERKRYIDLVEKSMKDIIKDEVKIQLPQILPKEVPDYVTHVIQSSVTESLKNIILAKSSSQPKSTYEATTSLNLFKLKKILLDKIRKNREDKDKDKDEDPPAGSDQGLKKQKTSKDVEPLRGNTDDQPNVKAASRDDYLKKPKRPPTLESDWNTTKMIDFRSPQTWINKIAKAGKPPITFDELMRTPIDFSAYGLNNRTQEYLVGPAFNILKGTCKCRVKLEYHFEECYKAVTNRLDWTNPEGHEYPFDLSKPLPLLEDQGRQVVLANYFINKDLEYLKGGSLSMKYMTFTTKTKAAKYDTIEGIEYMVPSL
nr:hypothetical protein [Tanacetum cinerariifolium]